MSSTILKSIRLIFLGGLFLLPLVFWPLSSIPYEIPKVWFFQRWIELIGLLGLILWVKKTPRVYPKYSLIILVAGFVLIAFLASILGVNFPKSFWGNYYRGDGLFTLFHQAGLFFFIILFWQKRWVEPTAVFIALGSLLTSTWAVGDGVRLFILGNTTVANWDGAIGVSFGQPKFLAGYLLVTLPFLYLLFQMSKEGWGRWWWLLCLIIQTVAIGLTRSLAGVLGIALFALLNVLINRKLSWRAIGLGAALAVVIFSFIYFQFQHGRGFLPEGRERIFRKAILGTLKRPLLGYGYANIDMAFDAGVWPIPLQHDVYVDKAHSSMLEVLASLGLVGLCVYLLLLAKIFQTLKDGLYEIDANQKAWKKTLLLVFLLFVFHAQTNIISIAEEAIFWLVAGWAAVVYFTHD